MRKIACKYLGIFNFSNRLLFNFNRYTFHILSGVLNHISDFLEGEEHVLLYLKIVNQALTIFCLGSAFSKDLIKTIRLDKS